ncbi:hypothetical protein Tco_0723970, partial [Tanacetum coccineum]
EKSKGNIKEQLEDIAPALEQLCKIRALEKRPRKQMVLLIERLFLELLPKKSSGAELVDRTHLLCLHGRERLIDIVALLSLVPANLLKLTQLTKPCQLSSMPSAETMVKRDKRKAFTKLLGPSYALSTLCSCLMPLSLVKSVAGLSQCYVAIVVVGDVVKQHITLS